MISANITATLYLVTGILFIMALRGLSSPETSRTGNFFGILGMSLAIIVTLLSLGDINQIKENIFYILIPIIIGGLIGGLIAYRVSMTAMPQLVAGFHSLVGLSAVLVGIVAFYNPSSFGIGQVGNIKILSLIEINILEREITLGKTITQMGNVAGLVAGLLLPDFDLIGRSLVDVIIEPARAILIPQFDMVKAAALEAGALGCSISGSGPSLFALSAGKETAERVAAAMAAGFNQVGIGTEEYVSEINQQGPMIR